MRGPGECPVQLRDGRTVDSWSPEWRDECAALETEALRIAQLPRFEQRAGAVANHAKQYGQAWADRLKARLTALRQARLEQQAKAAA
jgi:hypothetical protein